MATFTHGKKTKFYINSAGTTGSVPTVAFTYDLSVFCKDVSFPSKMDTAETSTFGSQTKTYVQGLQDATITTSGSWDGASALLDGTSANSTTFDALIASLIGANTNPTFAYGPVGSATGQVKYSGTVILTDYTIHGAISSLVEFTANFQITGAITRGVF